MNFTPLTQFRQDYYSILGQIAIAMGAVENQINITLILMLGDNSKLAANLTFGSHLDKVIEVCKAVFYSKDQTENATIVFEYVFSELNRLHSERNKNLHCLWIFNDTKQIATRLKIGKHKQGNLNAPDWKDVPMTELQNLNTRLWSLVDELIIFVSAYYPNPKVVQTPEMIAKIKSDSESQLINAKKWYAHKNK